MGSMFTQLPTDWELAQPILEQILQVNAGTVLKVAGTTNKRPSPPQSIGGTVDQQQVTLTWTMPDASSDITGWRVYKDNENNMIQSVKDPNTLSAIIKVAVTTAVGFWISSVNAAGRESIKVQAIATPKGINLALGTGKVALDTQVADGPVNFGRTPVSNYGPATPSGKVTGFQVLTNPDFQNGSTNYLAYDNNASGSVGISLVADSAAPGGMGQKLKIVESAVGLGPSPGLGGFYYSLMKLDTTINASGIIAGDSFHVGDTYIVDLLANIPTGYTLNFTNNSLGTGGSFTWLSSQAGTGNWQHYIVRVVIGTSPYTGNSAFPYFYLTGTDGVTWYVGQLVIIDIDQPHRHGGRVTSVGGDGTMVDWSTGVSAAGYGNIVHAGNVRTYLNSSPFWGFYGSPAVPVDIFSGGKALRMIGSANPVYAEIDDTSASGRRYQLVSGDVSGNFNIDDGSVGSRIWMTPTPNWGFYGSPGLPVDTYASTYVYRAKGGNPSIRMDDTNASGRNFGFASGTGVGSQTIDDITAAASRTQLTSNPSWGFYGSPDTNFNVHMLLDSSSGLKITTNGSGPWVHQFVNDAVGGHIASGYHGSTTVWYQGYTDNTNLVLNRSALVGVQGNPAAGYTLDVTGQYVRSSVSGSPAYQANDTQASGRGWGFYASGDAVGHNNILDVTGGAYRTYLVGGPLWGFYGVPSYSVEVQSGGSALRMTGSGPYFSANDTGVSGRDFLFDSGSPAIGHGLLSLYDNTGGGARTYLNSTPQWGFYGTPDTDMTVKGTRSNIEGAAPGWQALDTNASGGSTYLLSGFSAAGESSIYNNLAGGNRWRLGSNAGMDFAAGTPSSGLLTAAGGSIADTSGNLVLKNKSQATGSTSNPTTRSNTYAVVPELTVTVTTKGNKILLTASCWILPDTANSIAAGYFAFFRDGSQISQDFFQNMWGTSAGLGFIDERTVTIVYVDAPSAASHTYDLRWKNSLSGAPGVEAFGTSRQLQVTELG